MKSNGKINFNIIIYIVIVFMLGYLILHYDDFNFTGMDILGLQFDKKEEGDGIDEKELEYKATDVILNDSIIVELPTITSVPIQVTTMPTLIPLEYTAKPEDNEVINFLNEYGSNLEIGSYNFSNAWYTDGNRDYKISLYYKIQRIRLEENPSGCGISDWFSDFLWITGNQGAGVTLNDEFVGKLNIDTGNHGYLIAVNIKPGDQLCIEGENKNGFSLIFGPDVYYHYDSYCFRGYCK